jgi:TRAP-type C4-dicarboxylate transport system substrate-binding protein
LLASCSARIATDPTRAGSRRRVASEKVPCDAERRKPPAAQQLAHFADNNAETGRTTMSGFGLAALARALAAAALLGGAMSLPAAAADYTMKIGFPTIHDPNHDWANWYKAALEKATNGRIEVKIFPASQLGPIPREIEGVQLGTIEAFITPTDFYVGLEPRYGVFSIPTLFRDMKNAADTLADPELNKEILGLAEDKGLVGVGVYVASAADYLAKTPLRSIDDFKGKKFRINATAAERERMRLLGAAAIPMPLTEVVPGLERGVVDGTQSTVSVFVNFKFYDIAKVLTQTDDTVICPIIFFSKVWLDRLPPDLRKIVLDEAKMLQPRVQEAAYGNTEDSRKKWAEHGGSIIKLPATEQAKLIATLKPVGETVTKSNAALNAFYKKVQAVAAQH